jgi:hypothetical protein
MNITLQGKCNCKFGGADPSLPDHTVMQDLSLLTHLTPEDISHLQTVGKDAQEARKKFILRDDQSSVWTHLKSLEGGRLDFVLDNGGFTTMRWDAPFDLGLSR